MDNAPNIPAGLVEVVCHAERLAIMLEVPEVANHLDLWAVGRPGEVRPSRGASSRARPIRARWTRAAARAPMVTPSSIAEQVRAGVKGVRPGAVTELAQKDRFESSPRRECGKEGIEKFYLRIIYSVPASNGVHIVPLVSVHPLIESLGRVAGSLLVPLFLKASKKDCVSGHEYD
jgi:hypothetical protein